MSGILRISPGGPGVSMKNMLASIPFDPYNSPKSFPSGGGGGGPTPPPPPPVALPIMLGAIGSGFRDNDLGGDTYGLPPLTPTSDPYQCCETTGPVPDIGNFYHFLYWIVSFVFRSVGDTTLIAKMYARDYTDPSITLMDWVEHDLYDGKWTTVTFEGNYDVLPSLVTGHSYTFYCELTMSGGTSLSVKRAYSMHLSYAPA